MLMPSSASARNMRSATPVCVAMPRPTIDTFDTLASCSTASAPSSSAAFFDGRERLRQIVLQHGERDIGRAVGAGVLHDHVDRHVDAGQLREDRVARARLIGHAGDRDLGFVLGEGRAAHGPVGRFRLACR